MIDAVYSALADPTRREIVMRLAQNGPMRTSELLGGFAMSRQGASRHLDVLCEAEIVRSEKRGREIYRDLDRDLIRGSAEWLASLERAWDERLNRLESSYRDGD